MRRCSKRASPCPMPTPSWAPSASRCKRYERRHRRVRRARASAWMHRSPPSAPASCSTACWSATRATRWAGSGASASCPRCRTRRTWRRCWRSTSSRKPSRTSATCSSCRNLQQWRDSLGVFGDMLANRRQAYAERLPQVARRRRQRCRSVGRAAPAPRRAGRAKSPRPRPQADGVAFADATQRELLARLDGAAGGAEDARAPNPEVAALAERVRLAAGVLAWELAQELPAAPLDDAEGLAAIDTATRRRRRSARLRWPQAQRDEPARFERFAARIAALAAHRCRAAARGRAEQRAAGGGRADWRRPSWCDQKQRLAAYTMQAQFRRSRSCIDRATLAGARATTVQQPLTFTRAGTCRAARGCVREQAPRHTRQRADAGDAGRSAPGRGATRDAASRPAPSRPSPPTSASSTVAPRAPQRAEALRRLGDLEMDSADNQSASAGTGARLPRRDHALPGLPEGLPERPGQRPRALPAGARTRTGRPARSRAGDARPAGGRVPEHDATATRPSSAAASCCSTPASTRSAEQAYANVLQREAAPRSTTARSTCTAGRSSSRAGSKKRCARSSACST